jgi:MinD-like ATPase involved in chromosome partitioning or flagellar assembly
MAKEAGIPFLGRVPFDRELAAAADRGTPFVTLAPAAGAAQALTDIAARVRTALGQKR